MSHVDNLKPKKKIIIISLFIRLKIHIRILLSAMVNITKPYQELT